MIKERIVYLLDYKRIPKGEFYDKIGMSPSNFRGEAKKTPLNSTAISNILSEIPDLNLYWLITGEGEMLRSINTIHGDRNTANYNTGTIGGNVGDHSINISAPVGGRQKIIHPDRTIEIDQSTQEHVSGVAEPQAQYSTANEIIANQNEEINSLRAEIIRLQNKLIDRLESDK